MNAQNETRTHNAQLAESLARSGVPVFPCRERGERAKAPYTANGFKGASTDPETVAAWWRQWPNALPAVPTGAASGLSVIDGDIDKDTGEALGAAEIDALGLRLLGAVGVRTPSGGVHLWHGHVEGAACSTKQVADHVDERADGGYAIAPGAVLADGRSYRYTGRSLSEALTAGDLPACPLEAVEAAKAERRAAQKAERASEGASTFRIDRGTHGGADGATEADDAVKLDVLRAALAEAPNVIDRNAWVGLAASLKVSYGESLRSDFIRFSRRYSGPGDACDEATAAKLWDGAARNGAKVEGIGAACAHLRDALGDTRWKALWAEAFERHEANDKTDKTDNAPPAGEPWPAPAPHVLCDTLPPAPGLPLDDVLGPTSAQWVREAAEAKGAPPDYVFAALLVAAGAAIGNARWVAPWVGWAEPPVIWGACIGLPSAGKSPGIDAAISPLKRAEKQLRKAKEAERAQWAERAEIAKLVEAEWKKRATAALAKGEDPPSRPEGADPGDEPHLPRLVVNDATIEKLGAILARQPRGCLQLRDELAGWLLGMSRYSGGGSDRPFWLEAYGGRGYAVERQTREPLTIDRLSVWVLGGIQPDRLQSLLLKADDDGLLARLLPIWPDPAPVRRPQSVPDDAFIDAAIGRLLSLDMPTDETGAPRPWFVPLDEQARGLMDAFRQEVRRWESEAEGLLLSFVGKMPGTAARLALVLAHLDWAAEGSPEPREIGAEHFGRAAHLVESYIVPMARRAYAGASVPKDLRAARRLVALIREHRWARFSSRDVYRASRSGFSDAKELNPALDLLEDCGAIRAREVPAGPKGGRPPRAFEVNPAVHGVEA